MFKYFNKKIHILEVEFTIEEFSNIAQTELDIMEYIETHNLSNVYYTNTRQYQKDRQHNQYAIDIVLLDFINITLQKGSEFYQDIREKLDEIPIDEQIENAKRDKISEIQNAYIASNANCVLDYQGLRYNRKESLDNMITLCTQYVTAKTSSGLEYFKLGAIELPISLCESILGKLVTLRADVVNNVETAKGDIEKLNDLDAIKNYKSDLKLILDPVIYIEKLLL